MLRISIISLLAGLLLSNCTGSGNKSGETQQTTDSTIAKYNSPELKRINNLLMASPNNPDLYLQRGQIYVGLKDFEAGIADGNRALKLDSLKDTYYLFLTDAYFYSNHTRQAKEILERCIKNIPTSTQGLLKLAELYFYVKKYQESITYINTALKIDESIAKGYFLKGMCYKESGDSSRALSSFQTACEQDNQYYDAFVEAGRVLTMKKNPLALEYFNNALHINPKSVEVVYMIAKFYQDAGKIKQAVDTYNKLLQMDRQNKNAWYNLGAIEYSSTKDLEKAKNNFTEAINIDPQYADAYFARGVCFEERKDYDNAIADYKLAIQYKPHFDAALANLNKLIDKKKGK